MCDLIFQKNTPYNLISIEIYRIQIMKYGIIPDYTYVYYKSTKPTIMY